MTDTTTTPGAVKSAHSSPFYLEGPYLEGPLSWMIASSACRPAPYPPFKVIWRNEIGTARVSGEQVHA